MGPGADLFLAVHRPHAEEDLAIVGARDFRMADDLAPDRRRHEMAHVDPGTDCAFARLEVLLYGIQCRVLHDENQVWRREHRRQDTVLEPVRQMCRLNAMHIVALRAVRNRFHCHTVPWGPSVAPRAPSHPRVSRTNAARSQDGLTKA